MEDIIYYSNQIKDELDGAKEYILRALKMKESKDSNQNWISTFADMSKAEENHAKNLYDMFVESMNSDPERDTNMGKAVYSLIKCQYESGVAEVDALYEKLQRS